MLIAHISDTHIATGPLGAEPARQLHRALGRLLALDRRPDCVVITGDVANDGTQAQYEAFRTILGSYPLPVHLVAGNHDEPKMMLSQFAGTALFGGQDCSYYTVSYPDALLVVLDTHVPDSPAGHLDDAQLHWLAGVLDGASSPAVVALHHPPITTGIGFLDGMGLINAAELGEVIRSRPVVQRILAGHVHRAIVGTFAGAITAIAPSLYRQASLTLSGADPVSYTHEPAGALLHLRSGENWATHFLPTDAPGATLGYF
ncbi:MAG TPA: metallophosphoesterase [Jatrophihabitans sp.]|nr:metallophosphoesterase [Jatrophihabitans sp.]